MKLVPVVDPSTAGIRALLDGAGASCLFLADPRVAVEPGPGMFERMARVVRETGAGWVYADGAGQPRIDYQKGSVRDTFDFGPVVAVPVGLAREAGLEEGLRFGGLYDLRLRLSERAPVVRIGDAGRAAGLAPVALAGAAGARAALSSSLAARRGARHKAL